MEFLLSRVDYRRPMRKEYGRSLPRPTGASTSRRAALASGMPWNRGGTRAIRQQVSRRPLPREPSAAAKLDDRSLGHIPLLEFNIALGSVEYQGSRGGRDVIQAPQRSLRWIGFV